MNLNENVKLTETKIQSIEIIFKDLENLFYAKKTNNFKNTIEIKCVMPRFHWCPFSRHKSSKFNSDVYANFFFEYVFDLTFEFDMAREFTNAQVSTMHDLPHSMCIFLLQTFANNTISTNLIFQSECKFHSFFHLLKIKSKIKRRLFLDKNLLKVNIECYLKIFQSRKKIVFFFSSHSFDW